MTLPPPLTPARSDLRDYGFMPLEVVRFRGSQFLTEDGDVVVAGIMLWLAAWHEVPAASLPDDDKLLAKAAGYGRAVAAFQEIKTAALRNFVKCSDGRLYHPVVAKLANAAWKGKVEQRYRTEAGRLKKHNERHPDKPLAIPTFDAFAAHYPDEYITHDAQLSQGQLTLVATTGADCLDETGSKGESRERDRDRESLIEEHTTGGGAEIDARANEEPFPIGHEDLLKITQQLARCGAVTLNPSRPGPFGREMDIVKAWIAERIDVDATIVPTIAKRLASTSEDRIGSLKFYDADVRKAHALKLNGSGDRKAPTMGGKDAAKLKAPDQDDDRVRAIRDLMLKANTPYITTTIVSLSIDGGGLIVTARSAFYADRIRNEAFDALQSAATTVLGSAEVSVRAQ